MSWPRDSYGGIWPYDDPGDAAGPEEKIKSDTVREGDCEECGRKNIQTGVSTKDGKRICPFCLSRRRSL